ncbi:MAG: sigma 54-interacting transcriptional regulator [Candidatus Binataceae bacterium]
MQKASQVLRGLREAQPVCARQLRRNSRHADREPVIRSREGSVYRADRRQEGFFESANGGTILLDEITEMRCETQAKLLRVIEEGTLRRLGSTKEIRIDARVLASNRPLHRAIQERKLREGLYFRLKVFPVHLPPLRERIEDLPLLIEHFIQKTNEKHGKQIADVDDGCLNALAGYRWPGNVRELKHVIERAAILCAIRRH